MMNVFRFLRNTVVIYMEFKALRSALCNRNLDCVWAYFLRVHLDLSKRIQRIIGREVFLVTVK
jgi:hypothetical protein